MREVRNEFSLREVGFHRLFHRPIDLFNFIIGCNGIHRAEHLRKIHHMAGIEERDLFVPPFFAILGAHILGAVLGKGGKQDLFFDLHHFLAALVGHVHESAVTLYAHDLLDQ